MKVYVTKYALTTGIKEIEIESWPDDGLLVVKKRIVEFYHGEGREWHRSYKSAVTRAEEMRQTKIKSLQKQLSRMEKLLFPTQPQPSPEVER